MPVEQIINASGNRIEPYSHEAGTFSMLTPVLLMCSMVVVVGYSCSKLIKGVIIYECPSCVYDSSTDPLSIL